MAARVDFAEAVLKFTTDPAGLSKELSAIEKSVGAAASRMAAGLKTAVLGITGAVTAATGVFAVLVKLSANAGDEIAKLSQRVAIGAETLSGYKLAAELSDLSLQDFGTSLQMASRNIVEASKGTGAAAEAFAALGISATDNAGRIKTAEQIMLEVADRFAQMEDGAQKTAFAMDIFGRSGGAMIPLLNQGSQAIAEQRKEAELLGVTWTAAEAKLAEEFNDNLTRIEAGLAGFRNQVVQGVLPFLNDAITAIVARIKEWAASGELQAWAKRTSDAILDAFVAVAQFIDAHLVGAVETGTRAFLAMEVAARGVANGVLVLTNGVLAIAWAVNAGGLAIRKFLGIEESLGVTTRQVEERVDSLITMLAENSKRIEEMSGGINRAITNFQTPLSEGVRGGLTTFAEGVSRAALQVQDWAEKAKSGSAEVGKAVTETSQQVREVLEYQVDGVTKYIEVVTKAGQVSLKAAKEDAKAAKETGDAKVKSAEDAAKKEEEIRNKRQRAALGILGEVQQRLEEKGVDTSYVTRADIDREMAEIQAERAKKAAEAQRFAAGGGGNLADIVAGYEAIGQLAAAQAQRKDLGSVDEILAGGSRLAAGPLMDELGGLGRAVSDPDYWQRAGTGIGDGYGQGMEAAVGAVDAGLTKIEERVDQSSSRIAQTIYGNIEDHLVRRIMGQLDRN